jgi:ClpP class serine protease
LNKYYLLPEDYLRRYAEKIFNATSEDMQAAQSIFDREILPENILSIENETAVIAITGQLSRSGPEPIERYFGFDGTGYNQILTALDEVEAYSQIENIVLDLNTPGGDVDGLDEVFQRIFRMRTDYNIVARGRGIVCSAGYYLAVAAPRIIAVSPIELFGSIGVRAAWLDATEYMKEKGFKRVEIVSANAPKKTLSNKAGIDAFQEELNALERIFFQRISDESGND